MIAAYVAVASSWGLATHKDVVRDLAAFSLLEFLLDDFGEEFFKFF